MPTRRNSGAAGNAHSRALQDTLDKHAPEWDFVFQSLTAHAGGIGRQGDGSCGAYVGAAAFIGLLLGRARDNFADPDKLRRKTEALVDRLHEKFLKQYGSRSPATPSTGPSMAGRSTSRTRTSS